MPIYEIKKAGAAKSRMIRAKDAAAALAFAKIVEIKPVSAERMIELQDDGIVLEKAPDASDPATHAPGGELHNDGKGDGKNGGEGADDKEKDEDKA